MQSDEQYQQEGSKQLRPGFRWDLYYYERVGPGERYALRITPIAIIFMLIAAVIGFTILYLDGRKQNVTNVHIAAPSPATYSTDHAIIHQASPLPMPKSVRKPKETILLQPYPSATKKGNEQ